METVPRIEWDDLTDDLRRRLAARFERLGYLGDFFRVCAHQPEALEAFIDFTETTKAALPFDLVEVIALTAASVSANDYELFQHERLCATRGHALEWIAAVERGTSDGTLSPEQQCVREYVAAAVGAEPSAADRLGEVIRTLGVRAAVAVVLATARYVAHALVVTSFRMSPPVASVFPSPAEAPR